MQDTVITNAVVVLRDRVLENASVYIRNQLIQEVSQQPGFAARYAGARLVDARRRLPDARVYRYPFR